MHKYRSNGKLLLTAEYLVLDSATALAVPTQLGQSLEITEIDEPKIIWKSLDHKNKVWFNTEFHLAEFYDNSFTAKSETHNVLFNILKAANNLNPMYLNGPTGFTIKTKLDFPRNWGLGSSSTLINNIAQWAKVDPYILLDNTFGGSGYDIACASNNKPILYKLNKGEPNICEVQFNPVFRYQLYFVHLNKKQDSREGIKRYKSKFFDLETSIETMNSLTELILKSKSLEEFSTLIEAHENLIAEITQQKPVKELLFTDFNGSIKSLGAWGGDFVMVASEDNPTAYFKNKGYSSVISYGDLII